MVTMFGWLSADARVASRRSRSSASSSLFESATRTRRITFKAMSRPRRGSCARYTSPMPPAPSCARTRYGPTEAPSVNDMGSDCREYAMPVRCRDLRFGGSTASSRRQTAIISTEVQRAYERVVIRAESGFAASHVQAPADWQPIEHVIQPQQSAKGGTPVGHSGLRKLAGRFSECEIREPEPGVEVAGEHGRLLIVQQRRQPAGLSSTAFLRCDTPALPPPPRFALPMLSRWSDTNRMCPGFPADVRPSMLAAIATRR